jgi:hypothetical protein
MKTLSKVSLWVLVPLVVLGLSACAHRAPQASAPFAGTPDVAPRAETITLDDAPAPRVSKTVFFTIDDGFPKDDGSKTTLGALIKGKQNLALSVLIAELAKAEGLNVVLEMDFPDRVLPLSDLDPTMTALAFLKSVGQKDDFFVTLQKKTLTLKKKHITTVRVPPVGIVNDKKVTLANYDFWKTVFKQEKVDILDINPNGTLRFEATPLTLNRIVERMKTFAQQGEILDLQMAYLSLSKPMASVLPAVGNLPSTNLEPGRSVSILSTSGPADALMKALGSAVSEKESYHALLFVGDVGTTHSICDRGLRIAARREGKTVTYDLTFIDTAAEGCAPVGPSLQTEGTLGDTLTLNLSTNNAFVVYPERIVFKKPTDQ